MAKQLEYFFDYVSPFAYLASHQVEGLVERTGAELLYRPFLLGGVMKSSGNSPPFTVPNKGAWAALDAQRWAKRYGLPMNPNPHFPINTVTAMRIALVLLEEGGFEEVHLAFHDAVWNSGQNLADKEVLTTLLEKAGLDAAHVLDRCSEPAIKDQLRKNTDEAVERGAFGTPTFFVDGQIYFGNDRLDFVEEALQS